MKTVFPFAILFLASFLGVAAPTEPGLIGEYYNISHLREFPDLDGMKPSVKRIDKTVDFPNSTAWRIPFTNEFAVVWTGKIRIPANGTYTFYLESDDGSELFIYDRKVVDNSGSHPFRSASGKIDLPAGEHKLRVQYYQGIGGSGCRLSWSSQTFEKAVVPADVLVHETLPTRPRHSSGDGLLVDVYRLDRQLWHLPVYDVCVPPDDTRTDLLIAYPDAASLSGFGATEHLYLRWMGKLTIPTTGTYSLFVSSDDGSKLWMDGKLVVDNDGNHPEKEKSIQLQLAEGPHDIRLDYFQGEGLAGCSLWWEGPGIKKDIIPRTAFSH